MNPWLVYFLGVITLPAGWFLLVQLDRFQSYIRHYWIATIKWLPSREFKRWEWGSAGRCIAFTPFKRWEKYGIVFTLRPWRPIVHERGPSMADDIHPVEWIPPIIDESYNVPSFDRDDG